MSLLAANGGSFKEASALYAANQGQWVQVPLGDPGWTRPTDWLTLDPMTPGQQKVQCLVAVNRYDPTEMTLIIGGAYTVDWGDGTAPENYANTATAKHVYTPASVSSATLTTQGWLQAIVRITPQGAANIIDVRIGTQFTGGINYRSPVVEVVAGKGLTNFSPGNFCPLLHRVEFLQPLVVPSGANLFINCLSLREIIGTISVTAGSLAAMFSSCSQLAKFPTLIVGPTIIDASNMFASCFAMKQPPAFPAAQIQTWSSTFQSCFTLGPVLNLDLTEARTLSGFIQSSPLVREINLVSTAKATVMNSMFNGCTALEKITGLVTSAATNVSTLFNNCPLLRDMPGLDFSAVNSAANITNVFNAPLRRVVFQTGKGPAFSFTVAGTLIDAAQINQIYRELPVTSGQTVTVSVSPGAATDDPTIATAKGWTVA